MGAAVVCDIETIVGDTGDSWNKGTRGLRTIILYRTVTSCTLDTAVCKLLSVGILQPNELDVRARELGALPDHLFY